jgi:hypothetical protein
MVIRTKLAESQASVVARTPKGSWVGLTAAPAYVEGRVTAGKGTLWEARVPDFALGLVPPDGSFEGIGF